MFASLSIYGLYSYDNTIFDNLVLPAGFTDDERNDTIMTILAECSDLALLYPDWDFMKMLIGVWSKNELLIWTKMLQSERIEFNPIENYDRHETITRTVNETGDQSDNRQRATTGQSDREDSSIQATTGQSDREDSSIQANTGQSTRDETGGSTSKGNNLGNSEGVTGQTAYDSDTIKDTGRSRGVSSNVSQSEDTRSASATEHTGSQSTGKGNAIEHSGSQSAGKGSAQERSAVQEAESGAWKSNNRTVEAVTNHTHGNIGVTQAADMLERYRQVSDFCTIDFIVHSFRDRFCIQVY